MSIRFKRLSETVAAGILAFRGGRHLADRKYRLRGKTLRNFRGSSGGDAAPPGGKSQLYVSQDGRRYDLQSGAQSDFCFRGFFVTPFGEYNLRPTQSDQRGGTQCQKASTRSWPESRTLRQRTAPPKPGRLQHR